MENYKILIRGDELKLMWVYHLSYLGELLKKKSASYSVHELHRIFANSDNYKIFEISRKWRLLQYRNKRHFKKVLKRLIAKISYAKKTKHDYIFLDYGSIDEKFS